MVQPHISVRVVVCSLALALALLALAAAAHQPILSGAVFPDGIPTEWANTKEPCPTACIEHKSGIFLAVTSIGDGLPRVQFTCSGTAHHQPTTTPSAEEGGGGGGGGGGGAAASPHENRVHSPADPTPEQTPISPPGRNLNEDDQEGESTSYTDLHITAASHPHRQYDLPAGFATRHSHLHPQQPSNSKREKHHHGYGYAGLGFAGGAADYQPRYGFVFSPQERASEETEIHTTAMTFSVDEKPPVRSISNTDISDDPNQEQHSHHSHHHRQQHYHAGSVSDHDDMRQQQQQHQASSRGESITPAPVVTLSVPTSTKESGSGQDNGAHGHGDSDPFMYDEAEEQKAGPAGPVPEPLPAQVTGAPIIPSHRRDKKAGEDAPDNVKKVVYRVTTLIIETETVIAPAQATAAPLHTKDTGERKAPWFLFWK